MKLIRSIALTFLVFLALSGLASFFLGDAEPTPLSLTELAQKVNNKEVKEIVIEYDRLSITLADESLATSQKELNTPLTEALIALGAKPELMSAVSVRVQDPSGVGTWLGAILPSLIPILITVGILWYFFRQAQRGSLQTNNFTKTKAKLAVGSQNGKAITFKDVAGLIEAKEEVSEVVEFLKEPERFHKLGAHIPRGVLLIGTPGTGKTLLAKAVANEAGVPFYYVSGSDFVELFVGVGANRVRDTFEIAKKTAPSIIFIDEVDAVGRQRGAGLGGGHDEREQTLNQILVEMDGFEGKDAVVVMAATNRPDILDPALLRPGRFDRRVILDEPSLNDREAILKIHSEDKPLAEDINLRVVAERTPGFSGADLANLINEAAILAARSRRSEILQVDVLQAIEKVMLGPERRSHALSVREKEITAYHEAGHALVAYSLPHTDPVHKVSIVSRGRAGGYTLKLPSEDKHMKTRAEFESELAVLMGGYTAEQIIFGDITTGASNDLRVASSIARHMVTQYGMSAKIGPVSFPEPSGEIFLGRDLATGREYSEAVAAQIDEEVRTLLLHAQKTAKETIAKHREQLEKIAQTLIEKETIEQQEFYALLKG